MNYQMIETDDALASLCEDVRACPAIALDTEFVRTRTYYPQLGLIQLFDGANVALIDPLGISDWSPLKAVLRDTGITKFLHAGSEDLEVFLNAFGELPEPLIDTQILAAFCGRPLSWGFASMVEEYTGVALDKSESRTDWLARPLSERQCEYAAADVWYLLPIAKKLMIETEAAGWLPAALDECRLMQQRRQEIQAPEEAWRDITNAWQLRTRQLACLQLLADWRLRKARERDMAVKFFV
ncbi:ribonuclease D, partial [Salmonella enterica subsp. enterica serovar Lubbock]|nr:ribonuclease D [Salmonella enterica subsp. enterica serovar Lubbock]